MNPLELLLHEIWGELEYSQVDQNWKDIQELVNALFLAYLQSQIQHNLDADRDPLPTDDSTQGYGPMSRWLNTLTGAMFLCTSAAEGAAVWVEEPVVTGELGSAALLNAGSLPDQLPTNAIVNALLGTAAAATIVTSLSDTTAGRVLIVGATPAQLDPSIFHAGNKASTTQLRDLSGTGAVVSGDVRNALAFVDLGTFSGAVNFSLSDNLNSKGTLTGNITINLTDINAAEGKIVTLFLIGNNSTERTITWGTGIDNDELPSIADLTNIKPYLLSFISLGGGVGALLGAEAIAL